jgi:hypothetical protein
VSVTGGSATGSGAIQIGTSFPLNYTSFLAVNVTNAADQPLTQINQPVTTSTGDQASEGKSFTIDQLGRRRCLDRHGHVDWPRDLSPQRRAQYKTKGVRTVTVTIVEPGITQAVASSTATVGKPTPVPTPRPKPVAKKIVIHSVKPVIHKTISRTAVHPQGPLAHKK